jgi:hypothetical protein
MRPGFVGSYGLGPGRPAMRADTRENPVGKNGVMTWGIFFIFIIIVSGTNFLKIMGWV